MSWTEPYKALSRYNAWMNDKLYAACEQLSDETRKRDVGAFFKSIHGTLSHLLLSDCIWLARLSGEARHLPHDHSGQPITIRGLNHILYDDWTDLRSHRRQLDAEIQNWACLLAEHSLAEDVSYRTMAGSTQRHPLWQAVSHWFNHQTHHRGQVTTLVMQQGVDPGVTDLISMLREHA